MALQQLSEQQIRTWTRSQKDEWWFNNIYRGDMAQLTLRSALTGFLLGGILAATALYIGGKTGVAIGVNLISVILAFAIFRALHNAGIAKDFTILENNCTQSIATSAGYMITPMIASLPAYMLVTGVIIPWWQMLIWIVITSILGVLVAFPMKRRFINEDQLPFPEGGACGVVLDALYSSDGKQGMFQAKQLAVTGLLSAAYQLLISDGWMKLIQIRLLAMDKWTGIQEAWTIHERFDDYYYAAMAKYDLWVPKILGVDFRTLGLRFTVDAAMLGVGGLMGIRVASSVLLGNLLNFAILAPWMIQRGDIAERVSAAGKTVPVSRIEILNQWGLWWAVAMMVAGSLVGLLAKPEIFTNVFKNFGRKKSAEEKVDLLADIEVPLWISYVGVPVFSVLAAWTTHAFFGVPWLLAFISLPMIFVLTVICTNAMALTSWMPTGALSKITQFTIGAIDRSNPASNLLPAAITAEVSQNASSLLSDIKPGYMLGARPRQQAIGHLIGIISGALACIPLYFLLFLPPDSHGVRSTSTLVSEQFSMPAAMQWKGVADLIAHGVSSLPASAVTAMIVAAVFAVIFEIAGIKSKGRFPLSSVSIGLGVVLPTDACIMMWLGAFGFWLMEKRHPVPGTSGNRFWVDGCEAISAGLIAGSALIGIGNAIINVLI
ncbi:OPT family oligopeptide transporter [Undibacterium griseum]|uniref:OPT/YSL family transporter n=1 Tax=Undibacterium griseum TaxID=2762295 RepID=A0ABR6YN05_9BURK|nr:OPT family oligopeptide transporter [Undibacterium griseum]MBC3885174.1 OPT/YSL family transporter [Undibacterium griseum]